MARFYVDLVLTCGLCIDLPDEVVRHIQVRRLRIGDKLVLFNGNGCEYSAILQNINRRSVQVLLIDELNISRESTLWIGLAQAVSSAERMDLTLQKGVELGVNLFQPLFSERSIVRLDTERAKNRVKRWQEIVISACEQCGRNYIPEVKPIIYYSDWLSSQTSCVDRFLLDAEAKESLSQKKPNNKLWLMVGPEGGFTKHEINLAQDAKWQSVSLGKRILRTETAALAAVAALQTLCGDY